MFRLTSVENVLYHEIAHEPQKGAYRGEEGVIRSTNGGQSWETEAAPPGLVQSYFAQPPALPISKCLSSTSSICYRITGTAHVEKSLDGGQSWSVAWTAPEARYSFIARFHRMLKDSGCQQMRPHAFPSDLAITDRGGGQYFVSIAMGNEGIVILDRTGGWIRQAVGCAMPTPDHIVGLQAGTIATLWESLVLALAILIANPFYSRAVTEHNSDGWFHYLFLKFLFYGVPFLALLGWVLAGGRLVGLLLPLAVPVFLIALPVFLFYFVLPTVGGSLPLDHSALLVLLLVAAWTVRVTLKPSVVLNPLVDLVVIVAAFAPFPLWAQGIIPSYVVAWGFSLLIAGAILRLSARQGFDSIPWVTALLSPVTRNNSSEQTAYMWRLRAGWWQ
ncbi:MAG: hypothetical protein H0T73_04730 [Ardenticatenales bacterium]|nr:hypothetical protein [Ardenticatenales bacterium]